ncbi:hypothetical protein [Litorisediminicola beolgyonensis]|uniref:DUF732 domain-containing protein n=1 Tax=Litorisediminicola beolgyonensis TaxID=1173614 RepID=A0ABW3ZHD9_9RHOB
MNSPLLALVSAACLAAPALVSAQPLDCPAPAPVFSEADATPLDLSTLAQTVGSTELDGASLHAVADQVRSDYPDASDADIADILITAFCTYLKTDAPESHRSEANVTAFEQEAYDAVFGGAPPQDYPRQGWLYGN